MPAFSGVKAFTDVQKICAPRVHTAKTSLCQRSATLQRFMTPRKYVHPGIHTATTSSRLETRRKIRRSVTPQRLVTLRKHVYPNINTAPTSPCLVTRRKSRRSGTLQRLVTFRKVVHPGIHTATTSVFSDTANNAAFSNAAAFSDVQKSRAPRHLHRHDIRVQ